MNLTIIEGDILDIKEGLIVHQVNLKGVMGAGLAEKIVKRYPRVKTEYVRAIREKTLKLGDVQFVFVDETNRTLVANLAFFAGSPALYPKGQRRDG